MANSWSKNWLKRIAWLVLIWAGSVGLLALIAYVMRWVMRIVGLAG